MPPTRSQLARDDKVAEIIDTADARLASGGIQALSISGVARDLGLAHNAVYWYFPSRADLFVAVLRHRLADIAARKPRRSKDIAERVLWFTDQLGPLYQLQPAMQDLAREAPVVAEFVGELDALSERMLANVFRPRIEGDDLSIAIESFRSAVVGAYARGLPRDQRQRLLAFMLNQLLADRPAPKPHLTAKTHDPGREDPSS
jgi:AcrR family transcriptional regulator